MNKKSMSAALAAITNSHLDGYTPEILWRCLASWQYEKMRTEGYIYTCEEEGTFPPFSLAVVNRKIDWYSYLIMRMHSNA